MTRTIAWIDTLLPTAIVALFLAPGVLASDNPSRPPNVVIMLADDLAWADVGCYGSTFYETPHIDRLAAEGIPRQVLIRGISGQSIEISEGLPSCRFIRPCWIKPYP